jgi:SHS2 domain-containing protein
MKRYVLERLVEYNADTKVETWTRTNLSADDPFVLYNFISNRYRVFDTELNWIYRFKHDEKGILYK